MSKLRVVYAGTPAFAQVALTAILQAGYEVPLVLTQPDRPSGRGMKLTPSDVKQVALEHNILLAQPTSLKLDGRYAQEAQAAKAALEAAQPDVMVVAAYGLILPQWVLDLPRLGCLNIHASLLPRWRGAAPIHRAIEAGDAQTGVTIMQMDAGLDTGCMIKSQALDVASHDSTGSLHHRLAALGAQLIVQVLEQAQTGALHTQTQPEEGVCYAHKIDKAESPLKWQEAATVIERRIRAFDPFPGVTTQYDHKTLKIWGAHVLDSQANHMQNSKEAVAGQILAVDAQGIHVMTGDGVLVLTELQRPGGKRQPVREFLQAVPLKAGDIFA